MDHNYGSISHHTDPNSEDLDEYLIAESKEDPFQLRIRLILTVFTSILILSLSIGTAIVYISSKGISLTNQDVTYSFSDPMIAFTLNRENYDLLDYFSIQPASSIPYYSILQNYIAIIEPNSPMQLNVFNDDSSSYDYDFKICSIDTKCRQAKKLSLKTSETLSISCSPFEVLTISVTEFDSNGGETGRTGSGEALCLYVRREIQSLTSQDLQTTMDAIYSLWAYSEEEGRSLFGEDFHSASYFSEAHHFNAAWRHGDHIHEGLGFMTQHMKLTTLFEKAVQAVDPSVALPYWEFTIEMASNKTIFESVMFSPDTFGSLVQPSDTQLGFTFSSDNLAQGTIPDGRWAGLKADTYPLTEIRNSYGYMRAPWSSNPSPYITRFATSTPFMPTCKSYYSSLSMGGGLEVFLDALQKDPHANVHSVLGNTFGCDLFDELREKGVVRDLSGQITLCKVWSFYLKDLWRNYYLEPSPNCTLSKDLSQVGLQDLNCPFQCSRLSSLPSALKGIVNSAVVDTSDASLALLSDFICSGNGAYLFVGTHTESASAADPSFWPIHPTQERFLHAKILASQSSETSWPTNASSSFVCDNPSCYDDSAVNGTLEKRNYDVCCYGHYEYDQMLDFEGRDRTNRIGSTNHQALRDSDPLSLFYNMTYIYDSLSYSHCQGDEDVDDLLASLYQVSLTGDPSSLGNPLLDSHSTNSIASNPNSYSQTPPKLSN